MYIALEETVAVCLIDMHLEDDYEVIVQIGDVEFALMRIGLIYLSENQSL